MKFLILDDDIITKGDWLDITPSSGEVVYIDYINEQVFVTDGADNWILSEALQNLKPLKFDIIDEH